MEQSVISIKETSANPVSYTHLDVYKRQDIDYQLLKILKFIVEVMSYVI